MTKNLETLQTWNKVASRYEEKFMHLELYNDTYDFICTSLPKQNPKLLEIGCGPGNIAKYLLSQRPDFDIFGIDCAPNMIELAKKNNPKANFAVMDCREINLIQSHFDAIVGGFCLPYISQKESTKLIADSYNLLNDEGLLYLSFVEGDPTESGYQVGSSGDRVYFYFHTLDELKNQLVAHKFEELKTFLVEYKKSETKKEMHTILVARKRAQG